MQQQGPVRLDQRTSTRAWKRARARIVSAAYEHLRHGCACVVERVQDCSNLNVGPYATPSRANIALIELRGNGVVVSHATPHDLLNDWPHIGGNRRLFALRAA